MPGRISFLLLCIGLSSCTALTSKLNRSTAHLDRSTGPPTCHTVPASAEGLRFFREELASAAAALLRANRITPTDPESIGHPSSTTISPESESYPRLQLEWERGDQFPSLLFPDKKSLRLDPIVRAQQLHRISRIAVSPNNQQIALIATHRKTHTPVLLTINRDTKAWHQFDIAAYDTVWANDSELLVTTLENERPTTLYAASPSSPPRLLQRAQSPASSILLQRSRAGRYLFVYDANPRTSLVSVYEPSNLSAPRFTLKNEPAGVRCASWRGSVVCLSFKSNPYGDIIRLSSQGAREILTSGDASTPCVHLDADQTHVVAFCQKDTATTLKILSHNHTAARHLAPLGPVTTLEPAPIIDENKPLAVRNNSFLEPPTTYSLSALLNPTPLSHNLPYKEESLNSISDDGTVVPISLVRPEEPTALFIEAYGSYGISSRATYSRLHNLLLERGVAIAVVHVRGGRERGPRWHTHALGSAKQRSIEDLRAATETLQHRFGVSTQRTFAAGRSAGGWLIAKTALTHPHLFGGLVLEAPLLNLHAATNDPNAPLHHQEVYEWGIDSAARLSAWPLPQGTTPGFHVAALIPMRDVLTSPSDALLFTHAVHCTPPPGKRVFVMELPNSGHSGADSREEHRRWEDLQVAFIGLSE